MNCSHCGAPNPEGSGVEFCGSCGARLAAGYAPPVGVAEMPRGLRAMGLGDMFDEAIKLYRQNFRTFIGIVAVLQVPLVIIQMIQFLMLGPALFDLALLAGTGEFPLEQLAAFVLSTLGIALIAGLVFLITQAALASAISERYLGRQATVSGSYRVALACFWRVLWTSLLMVIILGLLTVTIVGIPFAIFLGIRWTVIDQAIVLENKGVLKALSRSSGLVKGSWWRVLGVLIVGYIAASLASGIPSAVVSGIIQAFAGLGSPSAAAAVGAISAAGVVSTAVSGLFGILVAPLLPTIVTLLYYDLRIRKEGYDLEVLAGQAAGT